MDVVRQLAAAGLVLALLGAFLWRLRRGGLSGLLRVKLDGRKLQCVERIALGPHHALHLVRFGDRRALLLACSPSGCSVVEKLAWNELETEDAGAVR